MNANAEIEQLLQASSAVLVRHKNHLVYRLPNGQNFVVSKKTSDPARAGKNNLAELRRALGMHETPEQQGETTMETNHTLAPALAVPTPLPVPEMPESLKTRIETAIACEESSQERLMAEAQAHDRRAQMLKALLPLPTTSHGDRTARSAADRATAPPQQITTRIQVTRQLVFAATQTYEETFTINDVLELMTGGEQLEGKERLRVRQSLAQSMVTLFERGELLREAEGYGKRQAVWRRAVLNGNGAHA
jgi:hypothetical protein